MNASNGKPPLQGACPAQPGISPYRRALDRHRAEQAAWQRVRAARIELQAAAADYELFWEGCPLPPGRPLIGGICELPDDERDDERVINGLVELAAQYVIEPDLETVLAAESDADAEAAELPAGGEPPKKKRERKPKGARASAAGRSGLLVRSAWR